MHLTQSYFILIKVKFFGKKMTVRKAKTDIDVFELECLSAISVRLDEDYLNSLISKAHELSQSSTLFVVNTECIEFQNLNERKKSFNLSGK